MLKKIIKHDSRAILHKLLPLYLVQLVAGGLIVATQVLSNALYEAHGYTAAYAALSGLQAMLWVCILVMLAMAAFAVMLQYHRSVFTDEGYLTMVIPIDTHRLFFGKLLSGLLWLTVTALIAVLSVGLGLLPTLLSRSAMEFFAYFGEAFSSVSPELEINGWVVFLSVLQFLVSFVCQILLIYAAITLGGCFFKKHKHLGSILFYFIVTTASEILLAIPTALLLGIENLLLQEVIAQLLTLLFYSGLTVGLYFLSVRTLRRFNIE